MKWTAGGAAMAVVLWGANAAAQSVPASESTSYRLLQAPVGSPAGGGIRTGETGIMLDGTTGDMLAGVPGGETASSARLVPNFTGQLYDADALEITASPSTVNEGEARQMAAKLVMDDDSTLPVLADAVAWSEGSSALDGISVSGLVTAATVYQDELAVVHGTHLGLADPDGFQLTVINLDFDDYGSYARDGLDDDWQVGYFGLPPNADAAPEMDADGDGQDNRFEFLSGFSPVDPMARFLLTVVATDPIAGTTDLKLNRMIPDRTYTLLASQDLSSPFESIGTLPPVLAPVEDLIIRDSAAPQERNFYIIGISKP